MTITNDILAYMYGKEWVTQRELIANLGIYPQKLSTYLRRMSEESDLLLVKKINEKKLKGKDYRFYKINPKQMEYVQRYLAKRDKDEE